MVPKFMQRLCTMYKLYSTVYNGHAPTIILHMLVPFRIHIYRYSSHFLFRLTYSYTASGLGFHILLPTEIRIRIPSRFIHQSGSRFRPCNTHLMIYISHYTIDRMILIIIIKHCSMRIGTLYKIRFDQTLCTSHDPSEALYSYVA
jgi:hypothetical protein